MSAIVYGAVLPDRDLPWTVPWICVEFIAKRERCVLKAMRPLPTDRWTCGWGETAGVDENTEWTQEEADSRFCKSLEPYAQAVREACTREPNENEFSAMVSLCYNIGPGPRDPKGSPKGFRQSEVLIQHNKGNGEGAARAFGNWNMSGGKVIRGLEIRRKLEGALYLTPVDGVAEPEPMPQTVEPESKLSKSPIAIGGAVTATAGVGSIVKEMSDYGETFSTVGPVFQKGREIMVDTLGVPPMMFVGAVLVFVGWVVVKWRIKQRTEGRA